MSNSDFHTLKGYQIIEDTRITPAVEDYLEMICRMHNSQSYIRVSEIAKMLNVKQSSVTKMLNNLKELEMINYEKYGYIVPIEKGLALGTYLLHRHDVLNRLLCLINNTSDEMEQVEKIEHFLEKRTIDNIERFVEKLEKDKKLD